MIRKKLWALMTPLLLTGCLSNPPAAVEPVIVTVVEKVPLRIYQPPLPKQIELLDVNFFVITEENLEEQVNKIEKLLDGQFVVFALVPDGYDKMAENFQEVRRYVMQQK